MTSLRTLRSLSAAISFLALGLVAALQAGCNNSDQPLAIGSTPALASAWNAPYSYQVTTEFAHATPIVTLTTAPAGMTVAASGLITWFPTYADLGSHTVTVEATDGEDVAVQTFALRIHQGLLLGVTLSPLGHTTSSTASDYEAHYLDNDPWGRVIAFHAAWRDAVTADGEIPTLAQVAAIASGTYGFTPAVGLGWADGEGAPDLTSESEPANNSWSNVETRDEFLAMVSDFALSSRPPLLFLGNETNSYYLTHTQQEWDDWVSVYEACYDAVKVASPNTRVYMNFQYEKLVGGGSKNGWAYAPQWAIVDALVAGGKLDGLAFTSYPYFDYGTPAAIPDSYYDEIALHWSGPVAFTEIGWLGQAHFPYPGGEADQAAFVPRFFELTRDLDLDYVTWLFLHDWDGLAGLQAFSDIGLRSNDAMTVRAADAAWQAEVLLREE